MAEGERWQRVRELFRGALEQETEERCSFLDRECGGDDELRSDVDLLLDSLGRAGDFLEEPATLSPETLVEDPYAGLEVGPYRLEQRLGGGGMGVVYLARRIDQEFQHRVAVKLLKPGEGGDEMVRRFRAERQILAALGHPNIAQLHDGGTTPGGLPYLVMEHVEGLPIDEYCDAHALTTRQRLELFCDVCTAVHFAHQNLVVHRDLKPSNILVTEDGVPKLLDFGIAKLIRPELAIDRTATALRRMTPEYASPEQVTGAPVSYRQRHLLARRPPLQAAHRPFAPSGDDRRAGRAGQGDLRRPAREGERRDRPPCRGPQPLRHPCHADSRKRQRDP